MDIKEATQKWVDGFNAIPQSLIQKAYCGDNWELYEITPPRYRCPECYTEYNNLKARDMNYKCECKESLNFKEWLDSEGYYEYENFADSVKEDIKQEYKDYIETFKQPNLEEVEEYDSLPMWGWVWTFESKFDEDWAYNNLEIMTELGFRIYESEELGLFFGIDGAGYNFLEEHWIPLYKARGLQWHDKEGED